LPRPYIEIVDFWYQSGLVLLQVSLHLVEKLTTFLTDVLVAGFDFQFGVKVNKFCLALPSRPVLMKSSDWKHSVIVSRLQEARAYLQAKDLSRLTDLDDPHQYFHYMQYGRIYHDDNCADDKGYFVFTDTAFDGRSIYITTKDVGLSTAFHVEKRIGSAFYLIKKNNNHEHHTDMSPRTRKWWFQNLIHVALRIASAEGNVVMFCQRGRSRSPVYLVVYLIIIYNMPAGEAMRTVGSLLADARHDVMDRHGTLTPIVQDIEGRKFSSYC
jgi:hypothetical protein